MNDPSTPIRAGTYPAAGDYYTAVQAPARAFTVKELQEAQFVWDSLGPTLARGSSAVVFQATVDGSAKALRCYIRNNASSRDRYDALGVYLASHNLSPYVSGATWLDSAIRVNGATWPVLLMDWIDGRTLNEHVDQLVADSNTRAIATLAQQWRELIRTLQQAQFAHGDLQHGDVLVDPEGRLRFVDYDAVWVPQLASMGPPSESGHPNYEPPGGRKWGRWMDTFPALVIYLPLVALAKDPGLWSALYNTKNLLFTKTDFLPPFKTQAWSQLSALHDREVDDLVRRLQECCAPGWVAARSLEDTLAAPALPLQRSTGSRMYEKEISRRDPACIVFLLDRSASMRQPWGDTKQSLAEGAAAALNNILLELMFISQGEPGKARHYFDVGVFGYGMRPAVGDEGVEPALGGTLAGRPIVPLPDLRDNPLAVREVPSDDAAAPRSKVPIWVEPAYGHRTPMCQAIAVAGAHLYEWAASHPDSFPPIVINITDGMFTDSPYEGATVSDWAQRLVNIQTSDGPLLLFNIFLSPTAGDRLLFPATGNGLPEPGPELFHISSLLPPPMIANARGTGILVDTGARGFGFNADPAMLARFLEIGTKVDVRD
jgi:hypothetical protein